MSPEGSNPSRCKPFLKFYTPNIRFAHKGFDPSWGMINLVLDGSKVV